MNSSQILTKQILRGLLLSCTNIAGMEIENEFWVEKILNDSVKFSHSDINESTIIQKLDKSTLSGDILQKYSLAALQSKPYEGPVITTKPEYILPEQKESDGRVRVTDATRYPYRSIGYFDADFRMAPSDGLLEGESEGHGTGFLVGPQHFLTAAHCLFRGNKVKEDEQWPTECRVFCGLNGYQQMIKIKNMLQQLACLFLDHSSKITIKIMILHSSSLPNP